LRDADTKRPPFDAVITRGLDRQRIPDGEECPDAETLAAYCERSLSASQSAHWEEHFSTCARCQRMLAAMARARTNDDTAPRRASGRQWRLYGAIAAGLVGVSIAVGVMRTAYHRGAHHIVLPTTELAQAPQQAGIQPKAKPTGPLIALNEPAPRANQPIQGAGGQQFAPAESNPAAPGALMHRRLRARALKPEVQMPESGYTRSDQELRAESAPAPPSQQRLSKAPPRLPAAGEPAAPPQLAMRRRGIGAFSGAAPSAAPGAGSAAAESAAGANAVAMGEGSMRDMAPVATPDSIVRWRLGARGAIEHLGSDGAWSRQSSGVTDDLIAGAAPSPQVCWAVGERGIIIRTTDGGEHWQRLNSPTPANLVAVSARDAAAAAITTTDFRRFSTADGGRTWRQL
jgi:hypothetical protein